jgi:F-type H+-transporting ATPase subunit gamma
MSRRRELENHRRNLGEIRDIMKVLAYIEVRKLARFVESQRAVADTMEAVAADFLTFHRETLPKSKDTTDVYLLIGSQRGFCGNFNEAIVRHLQPTFKTKRQRAPVLVAVGRKLHPLLERDGLSADFIEGASVVEEMETVLARVVDALLTLQARHGVLSVYTLYHGGDDGIVAQQLLPPFQGYKRLPVSFAHPPLLNVAPLEFLSELTNQYLFAVLHEILYASLMVENRRRLQHLEAAVKRLDEESSKLQRRCNALRQEEIIEEIEVILVSAASLDDTLGRG